MNVRVASIVTERRNTFQETSFGEGGCPPDMGRKKRKKNTPPRVINDSKQQNNKQKSNDISPATNQPKQKIVNQNVNPATNQLHEPEGTILQECSSDQQKPQINLNNNNTSEDSDDSQRLQIDESDSNVAKDLFKDNESITTLI